MLTNDQLTQLEKYLHQVRRDYPTRQRLDNDDDLGDEEKVEPELRDLINLFKYEPGPARGLGGADPMNPISMSLVTLRLTAFLFYDTLITIIHRQRTSNDKPLSETKVADMTGAQLTEIIKNAVQAASTGR